MKFDKFIFCLVLLPVLMPIAAWPLEDDRLQEIVITGDSASLDENTGDITYLGRVTLTQGSLVLEAEILRARRDGSQVVEISASQGEASEPVSYSQIIRLGEPEVTAEARDMVYDIGEQIIRLTGSALLRQSDVEFRGNSITYDIVRGKTEADGNVEMKLPGRYLQVLEDEQDAGSDTP